MNGFQDWLLRADAYKEQAEQTQRWLLRAVEAEAEVAKLRVLLAKAVVDDRDWQAEASTYIELTQC
jgi:hypothetical protein